MATKKPIQKKKKVDHSALAEKGKNPFSEIEDIKTETKEKEIMTKEVEEVKAEKEPRFLAIYVEDGAMTYVMAPSGNAIKKLLENVPLDSILQVWKGKPKELKTKSVLSF